MSITTSFIDLGTRDKFENYLYGGPTAVTYFMKTSKKSTFYAQAPMQLTQFNGTPNFGNDFSVAISRAGDYLTYVYLRFILPEVKLLNTNTYGEHGRLRWTENVAHNLIKNAELAISDVIAQKFGSEYLDQFKEFFILNGKGYDNLTKQVVSSRPSKELKEIIINLPLPFFFTRSVGLALPTAGMPYNEIRINLRFADWTELLCLDNISDNTTCTTIVPTVGKDIAFEPKIKEMSLYGNYVLVSDKERKLIGSMSRLMIIEQIQKAPSQTFSQSDSFQKMDLLFTYPIKALMFNIKNVTICNNKSNYTTHQPSVSTSGVVEHSLAENPISYAELRYDNQVKVAAPADYFSHIQPYFHADKMPNKTGYHLYSFCQNINILDPNGSTNFGKLNQVSLNLKSSRAAKEATDQKFEIIVNAINHNILELKAGTISFPLY